MHWNAYENWYYGVKEYIIESSFDKQNWQTIGSHLQLTYQDERLPSLTNESVFYRIKALEQWGGMQISLSNIVEVPLHLTLFVPNAFTPNGDGINDIFKIGHFGLQNFECRIYSQTGQIVAYSQNPDVIWDGSFNEITYPAGTYFIQIKATDSKGKSFKYKGSVHLIK